MKSFTQRLVSGMLMLLALVCVPARAVAPPMGTERVVNATQLFLATLDEKQQAKAQFAFDDQKQRERWSNFPVRMVPRAGLSMGELTETQRTAAMAVLQAALSDKGLEKVKQIMDGDESLKKNDRGGAMFGKDLFFISFLGKLSEKEPWMIQFGGHHLALNITIVGESGTLTPSLTAAQPATYQQDGKTIRPLGQENDKAYALMKALDDSQQKQAILNYRVSDLVLGPGKDGKTIQPEGLKGSAMSAGQREMLIGLIAEWVEIGTAKYADPHMTEIRADIENTYFAWSGPTAVEAGKNGTAYYRVQGPKVVIEYAPQRMGGDSSNHIHTIYRDPTNDYGKGFIAK